MSVEQIVTIISALGITGIFGAFVLLHFPKMYDKHLASKASERQHHERQDAAERAERAAEREFQKAEREADRAARHKVSSEFTTLLLQVQNEHRKENQEWRSAWACRYDPDKGCRYPNTPSS